ncbi:hypothetical protein BD413DRAFT_571385 [Trametes elegans]|nr:hypothetical protein BD413DRAFT_571385 [Trametes elegans]
MGRLEDAKRAFESQREAAAALDTDWHMCRAVGNLGMVNFQLHQEDPEGNRTLLEAARDQQMERVVLARSLKKGSLEGHAGQTEDLRVATVWETIGLSRLSLCLSELGNTKDAVATARESLDRAIESGDPTVVGMSRFFLVRALLGAGRADEAKQALAGPESESCTPAMALCTEPSEEHQGYLRETIRLGVDLDKRDDQGYSALDYAVFSGDKKMEKLVLEGLQRDLPSEACANRRSAAYRGKYYRELFQEGVRPLLLESRSKSQTNLQSLRKVFTNAFRDEDKAKMFDRFRFVRYGDFKKHGRLPRSDDKLAHVIGLDGQLEEETYVVFISYRWINESSGATSPDNADHTQYRRMLEAIKAFLGENPTIDPTKLGIWLDFACVDQNSPKSGVNALPMSLMQCNALISLVDEGYYTRAWCSIEALMIQTLRRAWGLHAWYVFDGQGKLLLQPPDREVVAGERLTYEEDRPAIEFLKRQSRLLGERD